jgi:hypothetical protein
MKDNIEDTLQVGPVYNSNFSVRFELQKYRVVQELQYTAVKPDWRQHYFTMTFGRSLTFHQNTPIFLGN